MEGFGAEEGSEHQDILEHSLWLQREKWIRGVRLGPERCIGGWSRESGQRSPAWGAGKEGGARRREVIAQNSRTACLDLGVSVAHSQDSVSVAEHMKEWALMTLAFWFR